MLWIVLGYSLDDGEFVDIIIVQVSGPGLIVLLFRYEFASPEVLAGTTEALRKDTLCMYTNEEVNQRSCHNIECRKKFSILFKCTHTSLIKGQRRGGECSKEASPSSAGEV